MDGCAVVPWDGCENRQGSSSGSARLEIERFQNLVGACTTCVQRPGALFWSFSVVPFVPAGFDQRILRVPAAGDVRSLRLWAMRTEYETAKKKKGGHASSLRHPSPRRFSWLAEFGLLPAIAKSWERFRGRHNPSWSPSRMARWRAIDLHPMLRTPGADGPTTGRWRCCRFSRSGSYRDQPIAR